MLSHWETALEQPITNQRWEPKRAADIGLFPNVSPEKEDNEGDRKAGRYGWREVDAHI